VKSLLELQSTVMDCLLGGAPDEASDLVHSRGMAAAERLRIYQRNLIENYTKSLRSSYPVIASLVGEEYFNDAARQLQLAHPSQSGDLAEVGAAFAEFLLERHHADQFRYLADIARLEWSCQKSLLAADHAPLELARLAAVVPADYDQLHFLLHPAVQLFESPYPCLKIWQSHADESIHNEQIDLNGGGVRVAIALSSRSLVFHPLSDGEYVFLAALHSNVPLAGAVEVAIAADPSFDAAAMMRRGVLAGLVVDFTTPQLSQ
jgi:hypothetical protein